MIPFKTKVTSLYHWNVIILSILETHITKVTRGVVLGTWHLTEEGYGQLYYVGGYGDMAKGDPYKGK